MSDPFDSPTPGKAPSGVPSGPQEVRPGCFLVGRRNPFSLLQCNTYVRVFERGQSPVRVCIDPGSRSDFPTIEENLRQLFGDLGEIDSFTINHQDPDVVGNVPRLCEANPNISAVMTEEVWRLVQHLDFRPRRLHFANAASSPVMTIADQHRWQLVPTPFCHFRGAMAFYDPEIRTLFSGDLFGGLNLLGRVQLLAEEIDWAGIAQFHQIYMPTREVLRYAVQQIRALMPMVEVIAPQHGFVITGDLIPLFLDRLQELAVGFDLLAVELDPSYLEGYREVLVRLIDRAAEEMGRDEVLSRLKAPDVGDGLPRLLTIRENSIRLEREGYSGVVKVFTRLARGETLGFINNLRSEVLMVCLERGLPIPPVGPGVEEGVGSDSVGMDGIRMQPRYLE
jgi:glyoxylase-like metal-dependent hydrolase (beta-lactamase superfamily II)